MCNGLFHGGVNDVDDCFATFGMCDGSLKIYMEWLVHAAFPYLVRDLVYVMVEELISGLV